MSPTQNVVFEFSQLLRAPKVGLGLGCAYVCGLKGRDKLPAKFAAFSAMAEP